jgi:hypothetical protein
MLRHHLFPPYVGTGVYCRKTTKKTEFAPEFTYHLLQAGSNDQIELSRNIDGILDLPRKCMYVCRVQAIDRTS